jgi:hypothetical protein
MPGGFEILVWATFLPLIIVLVMRSREAEADKTAHPEEPPANADDTAAAPVVTPPPATGNSGTDIRP